MFTLGVSDHVMIAHSFADPFFGPAQRLHGATYAIDLEVRAPALGVHHVVMDIGALRDLLRAILSELDYRNLDEHAAFAGRLSTTERVAQHVADRAAASIAAPRSGCRARGRRRRCASWRESPPLPTRPTSAQSEIVRIAWIVYGDLDQPTGGYVYDRLVVEGLRAGGDEVEVVDPRETRRRVRAGGRSGGRRAVRARDRPALRARPRGRRRACSSCITFPAGRSSRAIATRCAATKRARSPPSDHASPPSAMTRDRLLRDSAGPAGRRRRSRGRPVASRCAPERGRGRLARRAPLRRQPGGAQAGRALARRAGGPAGPSPSTDPARRPRSGARVRARHRRSASRRRPRFVPA